MKTTTVLVALLALIAALPAREAAAIDDQEIQQKRVLRVVTTDGPDVDEGEEMVLMGGDGEPLRVRSFFFHRGGYLGVQLVDLTPDLRRHFGVPESAGVMISEISDDGPAAAAGIHVGDIITAVDGSDVGSGGELARLVRTGEEGQVVNLEVWRSGKVMTLAATLAERDKPQVDLGFLLHDAGRGLEELEMHLEGTENVIRINEEHIHKALGDLSRHLESPEWKDRLRTMVEERRGMEQRIAELEGRLRELEQRLSKLDR